MLEANWTGSLSRSSQDVVLDAAEYAWPQTIEGCWKQLDTMLTRGDITESTYNEIKNAVTFEIVETDD